ncbi:hypothetical protein BH11PAT4_BH11PAT4_6350 [soil metagenome]
MLQVHIPRSDSVSQTFSTIVLASRGHNATGIEVPAEVVAALTTLKRFPVIVKVNEYTYQSSVMVDEGRFMIPLSQEHRTAANVMPNEEVIVTVILDTEPRLIEVPEDLKTTLIEAKLLETFEAKAPSKRKEWVRQVMEAKTPETRERRVAKVNADLKA